MYHSVHPPEMAGLWNDAEPLGRGGMVQYLAYHSGKFLLVCCLLLVMVANALPMMASNVLAKAQNGGVHVLLSKDDPPIHIGDGAGKIEDIKRALQNSNPPDPPDRYAWAFELGEVPDRLFFTVTIFSLVHWSDWECATTAWLNGSRVYDLRDAEKDGENIGSRRTTTARFSVGKEHLRGGRNTIEIREEDCRDTFFPALNDSLIKEVTYRFQ